MKCKVKGLKHPHVFKREKNKRKRARKGMFQEQNHNKQQRQACSDTFTIIINRLVSRVNEIENNKQIGRERENY